MDWISHLKGWHIVSLIVLLIVVGGVLSWVVRGIAQAMSTYKISFEGKNGKIGVASEDSLAPEISQETKYVDPKDILITLNGLLDLKHKIDQLKLQETVRRQMQEVEKLSKRIALIINNAYIALYTKIHPDEDGINVTASVEYFNLITEVVVEYQFIDAMRRRMIDNHLLDRSPEMFELYVEEAATTEWNTIKSAFFRYYHNIENLSWAEVRAAINGVEPQVKPIIKEMIVAGRRIAEQIRGNIREYASGSELMLSRVLDKDDIEQITSLHY